MSQKNILIVDDTLANVQLLAQMLTGRGYRVRPTNSARRALEAIRAQAPDLILLDVNMPEMDGYTLCASLKHDPKTATIPVIFLSALDDVGAKLRGFEVGGVDYIAKPFYVQEVLARVQAQLELQSQRQEIEALRAREKKQLEELNLLKDEVLSMVAHDLRNPLGTVAGYTQIIRGELNERGTHTDLTHKGLARIEQAVEVMLHLINDLLELVVLEGGVQMQREPVDLASYLQEILTQFILVAREKEIELVLAAPAPGATASLAPRRFRQVLANLLSNALAYTPRGGQVELGAQVEATGTSFWVQDTGPGIPAEALPHLFNKFYRVPGTSREVRGTGLGLTIVKSLVEAHGGQVTVDSRPGEGSRFIVTLPPEPVEPARAAEPAPARA